MRTIILASRKGGAGKTTLTCHLAVEAERRGHGPVGIIDTDDMAGLAKWWDAREAESPVLARADPNLDAALSALRGAAAMWCWSTPRPPSAAPWQPSSRLQTWW